MMSSAVKIRYWDSHTLVGRGSGGVCVSAELHDIAEDE